MLIASQTSTLVYLLAGAVAIAAGALHLAWRASRKDKRRRKP